jgi:hypothetical protein
MAKCASWGLHLAVGGVACVSLVFGWSFAVSRSGPAVLASKKSDAVVQSYSMLPGESMNFANKKYHRIEVRSTFPVRVLTGPCHEEYVVQFFCNSAPGDVFITDRRSKPLFGTPEANQVTITEIKK